MQLNWDVAEVIADIEAEALIGNSIHVLNISYHIGRVSSQVEVV